MFKKKLSFFALLFLVAAMFSGCGPAGPADTDYYGSSSEEEMFGGGWEIDLEAPDGGPGLSWPGNIPSEIPVFSYGIIELTVGDWDVGEGVMLQMIEIEEGGIDNYVRRLEGEGWMITRADVLSIIAEKGNIGISIDVDPMGEGTAFLFFSVTY